MNRAALRRLPPSQRAVARASQKDTAAWKRAAASRARYENVQARRPDDVLAAVEAYMAHSRDLEALVAASAELWKAIDVVADELTEKGA